MMARAAERIEFASYPPLPVGVRRHDGQITSDAGLLPVRQFDAAWPSAERMADGPTDAKPGRRPSLASMPRQRVFGVVAGHEDGNDHDDPRGGPVFEFVADDRRPDGPALAGQPTLSRSEDQVRPADLLRVAAFHVAAGVGRPRDHHGGTVPAAVTLDPDAADGPDAREPAAGPVPRLLRPVPVRPADRQRAGDPARVRRPPGHGTAHASPGAGDDLMAVVTALRAARPGVAVHARGDAGFGLPLACDACDGLTYTPGLSSNARPKKGAEGLMARAVAGYGRAGEEARLFECFPYQCDSWPHARTVVAEAECHAGGTNPRFVVTNPPDVEAAADGERAYGGAYGAYCLRGESGHRADELKNGPSAGRLGCHRFMADAFRPSERVAAHDRLDAPRARQWPHFHAYPAVAARANAFRFTPA